MHSNLHGNVVHHGVELLLLVSMLFLLAIPKFPLILKEFLFTSLYRFCISKGLWYIRLIPALTNLKTLIPFLELVEDCAEHQAQLCHFR